MRHNGHKKRKVSGKSFVLPKENGGAKDFLCVNTIYCNGRLLNFYNNTTFWLTVFGADSMIFMCKYAFTTG